MKVNIFKTKYKGFLLIELVIAIGIFSFIALLSLNYYWHIFNLNLENEMKIKAINIASSCMEKLQADKNISGQFIVDQKYQVLIEPISIRKGQFNKKFVIIKVRINWQTIKKPNSLSFVTGIII